MVAEVGKRFLPKYEIEEDKIKHIETLEFWKQEDIKATKDNYYQFSHIIRKCLPSEYDFLMSFCSVLFRSRLQSKKENQKLGERIGTMTWHYQDHNEGKQYVNSSDS